MSKGQVDFNRGIYGTINRMSLSTNQSIGSGQSPWLMTDRLRANTSSQGSAICHTGMVSSCVANACGETERIQKLEESEARRLLLLQKMKEAQQTIMIQSQRVSESERAANEKTIEVEQLKHKERENQRKLNNLSFEFKMISDRLNDYLTVKDDMVKKIDSQCYEMETIRSANSFLVTDCERKAEQIQQLTSSLNRLESQSIQHNADRDRLQRELWCLHESLEVAQSRIEHLERQSSDDRRDNDKLKQENHALMIEMRTQQRQLTESRNTAAAQKDELSSVITQLLTVQTELQTVLRKNKDTEDAIHELQQSMAKTVTERDRLIREKLELHQQLQSCVLENDQIKTTSDKLVSETTNQLSDCQQTVKQLISEKKEVTDELEAVNKVSAMLSSQLLTSQNTVDSLAERLELSEYERDRLAREHSQCNDQIMQLKTELQLKVQESEEISNDIISRQEKAEDENRKLSNNIRQLKTDKLELEIALRDKTERLHNSDRTMKDQFDGLVVELEKWKNACDRQTATVKKKDLEIDSLKKSLRDFEDEVGFLKVNHNVYESQYSELADLRQQVARWEDEVKRLKQERTENQQLIELLEMQKKVLLQLCQPPSDADCQSSSLAAEGDDTNVTVIVDSCQADKTV